VHVTTRLIGTSLVVLRGNIRYLALANGSTSCDSTYITTTGLSTQSLSAAAWYHVNSVSPDKLHAPCSRVFKARMALEHAEQHMHGGNPCLRVTEQPAVSKLLGSHAEPRVLAHAHQRKHMSQTRKPQHVFRLQMEPSDEHYGLAKLLLTHVEGLSQLAQHLASSVMRPSVTRCAPCVAVRSMRARRPQAPQKGPPPRRVASSSL